MMLKIFLLTYFVYFLIIFKSIKEGCMRKLLCMLCIFVLFIFLVGATNSGEPVKTEEKAVPGESFGAGKGISSSSMDEPVEMVKEPVLKVVPKPEIAVTSQASGEGPAGEIHASTSGKTRAYSEVLDSFDLGYAYLNDCEWDGRHIYIVQGWSFLDSADIIVFDPETGSIVDHWTLPFMAESYGVAFVNDVMYVSDCTNGMIRKINPSTHVLLSSFPAPGGFNARGMTSDGEDLYVGTGYYVDSIYKIDTLGNVLNSWYIGSFCEWALGLAYVSEDDHIWVVDPNSTPANILKVDLSGATAILLNSFPAPNQNISSGIAFDGSDLWFTAYDDTKLYRIDGGYSHSRIALFQDLSPWGFRAIEDVLYENGIPFKIFGTSDVGRADLSIYTKAIIASRQDAPGLGMFDSIATYRSWWENWISDGGVLEINGALSYAPGWEGLVMPGGFSSVWDPRDTVDIVSSWHPIVSNPYDIDDNEIDNWRKSTHGYLTGVTDHYTVIADTLDRPILAIKRLGDGGIIITMQPLEWGWDNGYSAILENVVKYWQYGVGTNVLFAIADDDQPWMRNALMERDSLIGNVDYMDGKDTLLPIPTVNDFSMYDVIVTYPNYEFHDEVAMGDTLAAFVDLGCRSVIVGGWSWYSTGNDLQGAIMNSTYNPFYSPSGSNHFSAAGLGWYDAGHPMMNGISTFSEPYRDYLAVNSGADTVAKYSDGEYLLGYKIAPSGGVVVGHNTVPRDTLINWNGQGVRLLANVINWSFYSGIDDATEVGDGLSLLGISSPVMTGNEWISLSIDSPGSVELRIINIAGMIVSSKTLNYTTPGVKRVEFDVSNLPSGPYFLSVKNQGGKAVRKALVIR
jgi:hypothetical protein